MFQDKNIKMCFAYNLQLTIISSSFSSSASSVRFTLTIRWI